MLITSLLCYFKNFLSIPQTPTNMGMGDFDYMIWCKCQILEKKKPRNIQNAIITFIEVQKKILANDALHIPHLHEEIHFVT